MRFIFAIVGAVVGFSFASGSKELFALLVGAAVGFAAADLAVVRARLRELESELATLRKLVSRQAQGGVASGPDSDPPHPDSAPATAPPAARSQPPRASPPPLPQPETHAPPPAEPFKHGPVPGSGPYATTASRGRPPPAGVDAVVAALREYLTGGNTLVRVGIIILFFGVAFLLRYVAEHSHVPIELRLAGVALGGIVLLVLGWRLRAKRSGYALALQGGGVGILYLSVFAGLQIYSVLDPGAAFALLALVAVLSAVLAVLQDSQAFALLGVVGGFLAPILASNGQGDHVVLFSYYAVLNGGIVLIAWFKAWRPLNLAGFVFTFAIGTAWGVLKFQPALFASTEPFLVLFFLFYLAISILFASRQPPELRGYVDGTLVFGTPIAAFGLQSAMLHDRPFALAYSALAASAVYLAIAALLHRSRQSSQRLLVEAFIGLGVVFLTLAVPLALDGRWSAATWALEGAALVWIGCRQSRLLPRLFGALLQIAGGVIFSFEINAPRGDVAILNSAFLGGAMVSAASVFAAAMLQRYRERLTGWDAALAPILFFWGLLWWLFSGLTEIQRRVAPRYEHAAGLLLMAVTALICSALHRRARIGVAKPTALWLLPAMAVYAAIAALEVHHPLADGGWFSWPVTFAVFYFVCKRNEGELGTTLVDLLHAGSAWLLTALLSWEMAWVIDQGVNGAGSWPDIAWALVPAITVFMLPRLTRRIAWPVRVHSSAYVGLAGAGWALFLTVWSIVTNITRAGDPYPLRFIPILNPLDLAELFVLLVLVRYALYLRSPAYSGKKYAGERGILIGVAAVAFLWLNAALLRTLHHWAGVPFELPAMLRSTLVQTSLSIFWTVLALATMLAATRKGARIVWLTGGGLLAAVIVKLFLVDLSRIGTIERIISFVGVGLLMLVIGYFSPLPPAAERADAATRASV